MKYRIVIKYVTGDNHSEDCQYFYVGTEYLCLELLRGFKQFNLNEIADFHVIILK